MGADLIPIWSAALERAGLCKGLSGYQGASSLAVLRLANTLTTCEVSKTGMAAWRLRRRREGRCIDCGQLSAGYYCELCLHRRRLQHRAAYRRQKEGKDE